MVRYTVHDGTNDLERAAIFGLPACHWGVLAFSVWRHVGGICVAFFFTLGKQQAYFKWALGFCFVRWGFLPGGEDGDGIDGCSQEDLPPLAIHLL